MTYNIDPKHSAAHFQVRHMNIAFVKGAFGNISGTIDFDPAKPEIGMVNATIDVNSLNTRDEQRDGHIKTPDIMNAAEHPTVTFQSTAVSKNGAGYKVAGNLTLRGVTKPVTLEVSEVSDEVTDPWNLKRRGATAMGRIKRSDFGMTWNMDLPGVGVMVSDDVDVVLDLEFVRQA
jgi:polyisoprenoid-binding protein YceI